MTTEATEKVRKPYPKNRKSRGSIVMTKWKLVYGVGVNDADYPTHVARCPFYRTWIGMLARCNDHKQYPRHVGCSVDPRWHSFMAFRAWMMAQNWEGNYLDKDILVRGNRVYGPDTCVFVSARVNALLNTNPRARGVLPIGVARNGARGFAGQINMGNGMVRLGTVATEHEAHRLWQVAKIKVIKGVAEEQIDPRVYDRLMFEAELIQFEYDNEMETVR